MNYIRRTMNQDPEKERRRLAQVYAAMSDEELLKVAEDSLSLTEAASQALDAEITGRNLFRPQPPLRNEIVARSMIAVATFRDLPEALLAKGSLESSGIECVLVDDNIVRMDWFISNFVGGVKLLAKAEDAAAATEILGQPIPEEFSVEGVGHYRQPPCPRCQSLDTNFQEIYKPIAYSSAWLNLPIPVQREAWKCHACGNEWRDAEPEQTGDSGAGRPL